MPVAPHQVIAADRHRVPLPFAAFAVRSDEPRHAFEARAPYGRVHRVRLDGLDAGSLSGLATQGDARVQLHGFPDTDYAATTLQDLCAAAPRVPDLVGSIAAGLQLTGVLGPEAAPYRNCVAARIDYLGARGAGFHNDVRGRWSRCLFWIVALDLDDVGFVMPHAGVQLPLAPADLVLFDPAMAHGLCRPRDGMLALESSFSGADGGRQMFLTGEVPLTDAQWAALGSPWLAVEEHQRRGALDLMVAEFDDRSGAVKRPHELRDGMRRSTCHVDGGA